MLENIALAAAVGAADENSLTALANKGVYKRALRDAENTSLDFTEMGDTALVIVGGEKCVIRTPLAESKCSCPSRSVCRHILTAIMLLKTALPADLPTPEAAPEALPETPAKAAAEPEAPAAPALTNAEIERVRGCAKMCTELLRGLLTQGLVRVHESAPEDFELAAVACHAAKMAECERLMRWLGGRLADCAARRASFDSRRFTERLLEAADKLAELSEGELTPEKLGSFRSEYQPVEGELDIVPVGHRTKVGGEYEGDVFYFLNADESAEPRFLTFSDMRPAYYDSARRRQPPANPWGLGVPMSSMMKQRMRLVGAKVCGGRLSSSKETVVTAQSGAVLDSPMIHKLMVTDFREIIVTLASRRSDRETDRLFFIYPKRLKGHSFDKHTQLLRMTFEDERGCTADCAVKYRAETKGFVELLERLCAKMTAAPARIFSLLVSADISEGRLCFYPIEVYDFIMPIELHGFTLPEKFEVTPDTGRFTEDIRRHLTAVRDHLTRVTETGLGGVQGAGTLPRESRELGMARLAELTEGLQTSAESCRHSLDDNSPAALEAMRLLKRYLDLAEDRLAPIAALSALEKERSV